MITIIATTNATADTNENSQSSEEDKLPADIQLAEAKVAEEARADRIAATIAKILLLLYVLVTGAVAWSTVRNNTTSGRLRAAESLLNNLQKEKIRTDSARKTEVDTKRVSTDAANALKIRTDEMKLEQRRIETEAQKEIARLTNEAEQARHGIATAQNEAAQANQKAEAERLARVELEESLEPRTFGLAGAGDGKTNIEGLKPFTGTKVVIEYLSEPEPWRAANSLAGLLQLAGWQIVGFTKNAELALPMFDGITLETSFRGKELEIGKAKKALVEFLRESKIAIDGHKGLPVGQGFPDDMLLIRIGFRTSSRLVEEQRLQRLNPGRKPNNEE